MHIRPPVLAGTWYPAEAKELAHQVDAFLDEANPAQLTRGRPVLAVVPHAGYAYSGAPAGRLLGLLKGQRPRTVFLLAPNHRLPLRKVALSGADAFATPLGPVEIDTSLIRELAGNELFEVLDDAHAQEHAVEIILPLLQRTWPQQAGGSGWKIVPLLVPHLDFEHLLAAGRALEAARRNAPGPVLTLVSSDFTHHGPSFGFTPFGELADADLPGALETLDSGAILRILAGDPAGLQDYGRQTGITMCGLPATTVALGAGLPEGYEAGLVDYTRSGDLNGDYSHSVSYAAILFTSGQDEGHTPDKGDQA